MTRVFSSNNAPQPQWMLTLRVGDVLRNRKGNTRVVRDISRYVTGELYSVTFSIQRCSWTTRPYTTYNYTDLKNYGYEPVAGIRHEFKTKLDKTLQKDIQRRHFTLAKRSKDKLKELNKKLKKEKREPWVCLALDCCDVHGLR